MLKNAADLILDTSVLIAYFTSENNSIVSLLDNYIFNEASSISLYGHNILKSEIYYIICRFEGVNKAKEALEKVENVMNTISEVYLFEKAAQIKCNHAIALSDCYSIALGLLQNCPVLFLEEKELSEDVVNKINEEFVAKIYLIS